uniref:TSA: Wollemia nobilis Ref_Wollemi_Transcript_14182_1376 transcribed RNA sequence n=1 Tax=Wollemia nobilis TaxID=56998 RepID=A0A0C9S6X7_9CONI
MAMSRAEAQLKLYDMSSITKPMALRAAVLLGIPDIIAIHGEKSSLSVDEIASQISPPPANLETLYRILRFLASHGVFCESPEGGDIKHSRYGLTPVSELLLQKEKDTSNGNHGQPSWAPYLLFTTDKFAFAPWHRLAESVLDGCNPLQKELGITPYEFASSNPQHAMVFNDAMSSNSGMVMPYMLQTYQGFKDIKSLVDVGGGLGSSLSSIVHNHPHIQGINFDLPPVVAAAPPVPGVKHVGGNMFEKIPQADAVFLKWVLHNWDDEQAVRLLKNCYEAIPANGKVIIMDAVVEQKGRLRPLQLSFDLTMSFFGSGAKERSEEEFKKLFEESGFKRYNVIKLPVLESIIEVSKD